jgi:hypothetical protein
VKSPSARLPVIGVAGACVPGPSWSTAKHPFGDVKENMMLGVTSLPNQDFLLSAFLRSLPGLENPMRVNVLVATCC